MTQILKNATEMSIAANLAGKAINISKTTAPHAASYPLLHCLISVTVMLLGYFLKDFLNLIMII